MSTREDLHRLLDEIPEVHLASVRTYLAGFALKPWDVYFANLPVETEPFTEDERAGLMGEPDADSSRVCLDDLRRELEQT